LVHRARASGIPFPNFSNLFSREHQEVIAFLLWISMIYPLRHEDIRTVMMAGESGMSMVLVSHPHETRIIPAGRKENTPVSFPEGVAGPC
jgi:hypothetical protein